MELILVLENSLKLFSIMIKIKDFQKYLVYNHAAGIGDPAPIEHVRAAMLSRINVHAKGMSGCRLIITQTLVEMLNKGVTPFVCEKDQLVLAEIWHQCLKLHLFF